MTRFWHRNLLTAVVWIDNIPVYLQNRRTSNKKVMLQNGKAILRHHLFMLVSLTTVSTLLPIINSFSCLLWAAIYTAATVASLKFVFLVKHSRGEYKSRVTMSLGYICIFHSLFGLPVQGLRQVYSL